MNGIGAIKTALEGTRFLLKMYVEDLSDADLFVRPVPAANHAAWQIGQVIVGDAMLVKEQLPTANYPRASARLGGAVWQGGGEEGRARGVPDEGRIPGPVRLRPLGDDRRARDPHRRRPRPPDDGQSGGVRPDAGPSVPARLEPHAAARRAVHGDPPEAGQAGPVLTSGRRSRPCYDTARRAYPSRLGPASPARSSRRVVTRPAPAGPPLAGSAHAWLGCPGSRTPNPRPPERPDRCPASASPPRASPSSPRSR